MIENRERVDVSVNMCGGSSQGLEYPSMRRDEMDSTISRNLAWLHIGSSQRGQEDNVKLCQFIYIKF